LETTRSFLVGARLQSRRYIRRAGTPQVIQPVLFDRQYRPTPQVGAENKASGQYYGVAKIATSGTKQL
jgi:hypothetical protein